MTPGSDGEWAGNARNAREALRLLGYPPPPPCLPDEPEACGGGFADHMLAYLASIQAVVGHHLTHFDPRREEMRAAVYASTAAELSEACTGGDHAREA